jgi:uncharacterized protein
MLFVPPQPARFCLWMQHTQIPLSAAFIDAHGKIINIVTMQPLTTDYHCAAAPARYALETNQGWFAQHQISAGMAIGGLSK